MINKVVIVSIVYKENEWQETKKCVEACGVPVVYVERRPEGIGSLAEAINRGFKEAKKKYEPQYVWFVTNITFDPQILEILVSDMDKSRIIAALHPYFNSDHKHLQRFVLDTSKIFPNHFVRQVPFIEFTAAIVKSEIFEKFPLDEQMPYVGHDMAWSYEITRAGFYVGVHDNVTIGHTYIRHKDQNNKFTKARRKMRRHAVEGTKRRLIELYGKDYQDKIQYHDKL